MLKPYLIFLLSAVTIAVQQASNCRCRPHDPCWPSQQEWAILNNTVQGNLVAVRPAASVCHEYEYNAQECKTVKRLWSNSVWRSAEPGAVQWQNWEAWPEHHQSCYIESSQNTTCGQGRISLYSVKAQTVAQVQRAVRFANEHDLRVVIKNTGHDFLGRSSAPESLQIMTHSMQNIQVVDDFVPEGAPGNRGEGSAVTMEAGMQLPKLYRTVALHNRTVVAGSSHTVGAVGGYIQGGGHSPFGAWGGLASDNALEFEVVTANGSIVIANSYQNSDLFWALRGGGGGTFGVVTKATVRTLPEAPVVLCNLNITTVQGDSQFWDALAEFHAVLPSLNDANGSGYYYTVPNVPLDAKTSVSAMTSLLMFPGYTDITEIEKLYQPLLARLSQFQRVKVQKDFNPLPSINATIFTLLLGGTNTDTTGDFSILTSRLFSKDLLVSRDGPRRLINAWKSIKFDANDVFVGHLVAGGKVETNGDKIDSAVNPAWRKTVTHMLFSRSWAANSTLEQQTDIIKNMTDVEIPILRSVEGEENMGAYLNEANAYEPGFQQSFWGNKYPRLYSIKQRWDPDGLFIARKGVGSEDWDDAGLCKIVGHDDNQCTGSID
ncbi:hypothetical protein Plec18167_002752 [Paecilomyces lecythidis]|uniref:FAD-binding PCMH-type domain-containing protein n=1 Tax=Paecilomyces lecythidis TaxID=3004212 RepID=A0ABR3Y7Q3_9EURO